MSSKLITKEFLVALLKKLSKNYVKIGSTEVKYSETTAKTLVDTYERMMGVTLNRGFIEDIGNMSNVVVGRVYLSKTNPGQYLCLRQPDNINKLTDSNYFINISDKGLYDQLQVLERSIQSGGTGALRAIENLKKQIVGGTFGNTSNVDENFPLSSATAGKVYFYQGKSYLCLSNVSGNTNSPNDKFVEITLNNLNSLKADKEPVIIGNKAELNDLETGFFAKDVEASDFGDLLPTGDKAIGYTIRVGANHYVQRAIITANSIPNGKYREVVRVRYGGSNWTAWSPSITGEVVSGRAHLDGGANKIPNADSVKATYDKIVAVERKLGQAGLEDNQSFFKADGDTEAFSNQSALTQGKKSGVYKVGDTVVTHFKGSEKSFQLQSNGSSLYFRAGSGDISGKIFDRVATWDDFKYSYDEKNTSNLETGTAVPGVYKVVGNVLNGRGNFSSGDGDGLLFVYPISSSSVYQLYVKTSGSIVENYARVVDKVRGTNNVNKTSFYYCDGRDRIMNYFFSSERSDYKIFFRENEEVGRSGVSNTNLVHVLRPSGNNWVRTIVDYDGNMLVKHKKNDGVAKETQYWGSNQFEIKDLRTENLDEIVFPGTYSQVTQANCTSGRNYPILEAGLLETLRGGSGANIIQRYTSQGGAVFIRHKNGSNWGSWERVGNPDAVRTVTNQSISGQKTFNELATFKTGIDVSTNSSDYSNNTKATLKAGMDALQLEYRNRNTLKGTLKITNESSLKFNDNIVYHSGNLPNATTSSSGKVLLTNTVNTDDDRAITPRGVSNYAMSKSGGTFTGRIEFDINGASYIEGKTGQTRKWLVGRSSGSNDDVELKSFVHNTYLTLKADKVQTNRDIYVNNDKVLTLVDMAKSLGLEYGGSLRSSGYKTSGKAYWDSTTNKMYKCKSNTSSTTPDTSYFVPMDNHSLLDRLENSHSSESISYEGRYNSDGVSRTINLPRYKLSQYRYFIVYHGRPSINKSCRYSFFGLCEYLTTYGYVQLNRGGENADRNYDWVCYYEDGKLKGLDFHKIVLFN